MRRREFITLIGGAAALPFAALAQQPGRVRRIGYLSPARLPQLLQALHNGLREFGFTEGQSIVID